jgi:hypothetical protein
MKKFLFIIKNIFKIDITKTIIAICDMIKSLFLYKRTVIKNKIDEQKKKENIEFNKKVDEVVDNGTIDDLLDLKRK